MKPWMLAIMAGGPELRTKTFTANETFIVPLGVSQLESVGGKGADGTPSSSGVRTASTQSDSIQGFGSGNGNSVGSLSWSDFEVDVANAFNAVNAGGSGVVTGVNYVGYPNSNTYTISLMQGVYSNAIAGTATAVRAAGWKTSGPVLAGDYGYAYIEYTQTYTIPKTVGAAASGFGRTCPGGDGGAASTTNYGVTPVTPGGSYNIVVPAGGSITITYYQ